MIFSGEIQFHHGRQAIATLALGLCGWSGLVDRAGADVPFPDDIAQAIALIPEDARLAIAKEIRFGAEVTVAEGE